LSQLSPDNHLYFHASQKQGIKPRLFSTNLAETERKTMNKEYHRTSKSAAEYEKQYMDVLKTMPESRVSLPRPTLHSKLLGASILFTLWFLALQSPLAFAGLLVTFALTAWLIVDGIFDFRIGEIIRKTFRNRPKTGDFR